MATENCYLRLNGIRGMSKAIGHHGDIDILKYFMGIPVNHSGGAMVPKKLGVSEIRVRNIRF